MFVGMYKMEKGFEAFGLSPRRDTCRTSSDCTLLSAVSADTVLVFAWQDGVFVIQLNLFAWSVVWGRARRGRARSH